MTSEEIRAMFFDSTALHEPTYRLYQLNQEGYRYYYRFDEQGEVHYYPSVTTMLGQVMPTSPHLIDWMLANGKEQAVEKRDMAAAYGTFMHGCFERLVIERTFDLDGVYATLLEYMEQNNIPESYFGEWLVKVQVRPDDAAVEGGAVNMGKIYRIQKMLANFEHLRAVIDLSGIPYCLVHPMKWQARLCLRQKGEQKADRKKRYKEVAQKLYPDVKATMWNCDAILLMEFGRAMLSDLKGRKWILENIPKREHDKLFLI